MNGLKMYYEIHGDGRPLVLLHGGLGGIDMFSQLLPGLDGIQAIGVELQGNGHTADIDRPFSFEQMADDVAALINHLGLASADLLGYSLGGGVALQTAIRHPQAVRKLIAVSTPFKSDGWYPESRAGMNSMSAEIAKSWVGSPMHQAYVKVAPKPEDWPSMVVKTGQMVGQDYDWSKGVAALKAPTLIVVGDADGVRCRICAASFVVAIRQCSATQYSTRIIRTTQHAIRNSHHIPVTNYEFPISNYQ